MPPTGSPKSATISDDGNFMRTAGWADRPSPAQVQTAASALFCAVYRPVGRRCSRPSCQFTIIWLPCPSGRAEYSVHFENLQGGFLKRNLIFCRKIPVGSFCRLTNKKNGGNIIPISIVHKCIDGIMPHLSLSQRAGSWWEPVQADEGSLIPEQNF